MIASRITTAFLAIGLSGASAADVPFGMDDGGDYWNPEVITPTGNPTRISETPSATYVITGDEIRRSGASSLPEILRRVPGLEVRTMGATDAQIGARGQAWELARHVLVLVDGMTAQVDFFGGTVWDTLHLSPLDIDRIEVVLGPGAAVYGNSAMLGTINVITRSATDYPRPEAEATVGVRRAEGFGGSEARTESGDVRASMRHGVVRGPWRARAGGSFRRVPSFPDPERETADLLQAFAGNGRFEYHPSPDVRAGIEGGIHHGRTEVNAVAAGLDPYVATLGHLRADGRLGLGGPGAPGGEVSVMAVWSSGRIWSPSFPGPDGFEAAFHTAYLEAAHSLRYTLFDRPMLLRWGGETRLNTLGSTITTDEQDIYNLAAFASNEILLDRLRLTGGLRVDFRTLTGAVASPRLSAVWALNRDHQLRVAYNEGYKNPTLVLSFADFESVPGAPAIGNRALLPERIRYAEAGYTGIVVDGVRIFANAFAYRLHHLTARNFLLADREVHWENSPPVDGFGGETGANFTIRPDLSGYASYAYVLLVPHDDFPYQAGNLGSPRHKVGAGVAYGEPHGLYLTLDAQYFGASAVDRQPLVDGNVVRDLEDLAHFLVVHGRAGYRLNSGLDLSLAGTLPNLLGIDRPTPLGRPVSHFPGAIAPPASLLVRLAWHP
jgi:outer membrane receptor for ferrienterochelin and colicin